MPKSYQTIIAFDYGLRRIGVATGQFITKTASPQKTIDANNAVPNWKAIDTLMTDWQPDVIIVGIPLSMDGKTQAMTTHTNKFISDLKDRLTVPIFATDERLTTKASREEIFARYGYKGLKKISIDGVAAALILEQWMNEQT